RRRYTGARRAGWGRRGRTPRTSGSGFAPSRRRGRGPRRRCGRRGGWGASSPHLRRALVAFVGAEVPGGVGVEASHELVVFGARADPVVFAGAPRVGGGGDHWSPPCSVSPARRAASGSGVGGSCSARSTL